VLYLVLALISPASLGMGDVKLAGVLGLLMAYMSWRTLLYGATGAFVISAVIGIGILVTRRGNRRTQLPFGPSMLLAALVAIVATGS
jgi:leader peptidase (prepilin peptidase)/N-methyltransferase